ncbi:MAG: hypothetical protein ACE5H7_18345, partial [Acidiferrobacterales bacterium]
MGIKERMKGKILMLGGTGSAALIAVAIGMVISGMRDTDTPMGVPEVDHAGALAAVSPARPT